MRPSLQAIEIVKEGNQRGTFIVRTTTASEVRIAFEGSLPISSTDQAPSAKEDFKADTVRQHVFESICHALRLSYDGIHTPYRFFDCKGKKYNLDSSSAYWLLQTKRWVRTTDELSSTELMLRFTGSL